MNMPFFFNENVSALIIRFNPDSLQIISSSWELIVTEYISNTNENNSSKIKRQTDLFAVFIEEMR